MAMVRTIQHPGVQIQESEIGGYTKSVVMNNAYIMGFTDRGPIYDYSWITTSKEFTKIYGEPQTEAEKYLFTAVQSVLNNGGTPIVARVPYDNKQCKAYKALKMKWMDTTDVIADEDGQFIDTDLASPLVPLTSVMGEINMNRSFKDIFTSGTVTVNDQLVDQEYIDTLSVTQILKQLNPYKSGNAKSEGEMWDGLDTGFKLNGVYPSSLNIDQIAISSMISSIENDEIKRIKNFYAYDEGLNVIQNKSLADLKATFNNNGYLYEITDKFVKVADSEGNLSAYINLFGTSTEDLNDKPVYLPTNIPAEIGAILTGSASLSAYYHCEKNVRKEINVESSYFDLTKLTSTKLGALIDAELVVQGDPVGYIDSEATCGYQVDTKCNKLPVCTAFGYKKISSYILDDMVQTTTTNGVSTVTGINTTNLLKVYRYTSTGATNGSVKFNVVGQLLTDGVEVKYKTDFLDTLFEIYEHTVNGFPVDVSTSGDVTFNSTNPYDKSSNDGRKLVAYLNADVESPAVFGEIEVDGTVYKVYSLQNIQDLTWSTYKKEGSTTTEIKHYYIEDDRATLSGMLGDNMALNSVKYDRGTFANLKSSGDVTYTYCWKCPYTGYLDDVPVVDIDDDLMVENESVIWIKTIYNDARFLMMDEMNYIRLEASLMNTPEMGFKYGLYLDSEDCEISNDQYDDLVTVNQFKTVDRSVSKYGNDIDDANFIIVDKSKSVVQGVGGNIGFFSTVIDPFDALKVQRILVNPAESIATERTVNVRDENGAIIDTKTAEFDHSDANINRLDYWAYESANAWNTIYDDLLDSMDCLQRVKNADGIYIGEPNPIDGKQNLMDSWSTPLTGLYSEDSISKLLMRKFPGISMADIDTDSLDNPDYVPSIIDHQFATHIMVAVCKTTIDPTTGKITVSLVETFFGSLFNEKNIQNGRSLYIGDIINGNSDYIEFYRNNYVSAGEAGAYDPPEYRRTDVNQIFIKDSEDLKNASALRGIDADDYGMDSPNKEVREAGEANYYKDLAKKHIYAIDKKDVCIYNLHWEANFTSFSKKESQKIIANTSGLYSVNDGTTINVAKNFLVDIDRCIKFIKNRDEIPLHFVCDAGLSTIAQFCDNVVWNPNKMTVVGEEIDPVTKKKNGKKIYTKTGGWITQPFAPDDDPDGEDRYITGYADIATWRKVVERIDGIASDIRKDCFAIIDAPRQLTLDGAAPKLRRSKFTNNFDKTIGKAMRFITGINSSYSAGYYNWLRTTDQYTGKSIWIPPTSKIIGNYCYLNINNLPWLAPAGLTYGLISGVHAVSHNPDYQEEDQIYLKSWNYIKQYPIEGFVVEGQKTLLGKESVFERVNVRLLFLDLERFAYNVSRTFKYQVNNTYTREQFVATLKPKFEDYTLRGGIYEYLIKVDDENNTPETIDQNELRGDIFIKPARLIEFILLNFVGTSTGTDFTELQLG